MDRTDSILNVLIRVLSLMNHFLLPLFFEIPNYELSLFSTDKTGNLTLIVDSLINHEQSTMIAEC